MTSFRTTPWGPPGLIALCLAGTAAPAVPPAAVLPQAARIKAGEHLVFSVLAGPGETRPRATTTDMGRERAPLLGRPLSHRRERSCTIMGPARVEGKHLAAAAARKETSAPSPWLWSLWDEDGRPVTDAKLGTLDDQGRYTAPRELASAILVKIRAAATDSPLQYAEATLLVLPFEPFNVLDKFLGPHWMDTFSETLPFRDLTTGKRFDEKASVEEWTPAESKDAPLLAGFGRPVTVRWESQPGPLLLSYLEGGQLVRKTVTGLDSMQLAFRGRVDKLAVESLRPSTDQNGAWISSTQSIPMVVRGLSLAAGHPDQDGQYRPGSGAEARFQSLSGMTMVPGSKAGESYSCLATDAKAHVLVRHTGLHEVATLAGTPGQHGFRNGCGKDALFNRPGFLASTIPADGKSIWACAVADSGNHAIRLVADDGTVTTLAGTGQKGYLDGANPLTCRFDNPQGLAWDDDGTLYVADQGNWVIRRIKASGRVDTFAGTPGVLGSADGKGAEARFTALKGLTFGKRGQVPVLYAVDGHAIRMINLRTREVTTLLGQVNSLGYQDAWAADAEDSTGALRQPILHAPWAIENADEFLIITDQGNHSVRIFWHLAEAPSLQTLAGHPWAPETRWGLLMDTVQGVGDENYGSLACPSGLAWDRARGALLVANGSCLAAIDGIAEASLQPIKCSLRCPETVAPGPFTVKFVARIPTRKDAQPPVRPVQFTVEFYEEDGTLARRVELAGRSSEGKTRDHKTLGTFKAEGTFSKRGRAFVVLRCVTDQGHSDGALSYVTVE